MRRPAVLLSLLATLALGLSLAAPPATATAPARSDARASGWCHRTLAHYPVLRPGARRPAVRTLQCALNDAGYGPVVVDGFYGPQTRRAVSKVESGFEGAAPHPGRVNNGFWVLLFGQHLPDRDLRLGNRGPALKTLQRALRAAGARVTVDGSFGPQTRRAVKRYQGSNGVAQSGVVNENTRFFLVMGGVIGSLN